MTPSRLLSALLLTWLIFLAESSGQAKEPSAHWSISGIYPHLAMFNSDGECGTGAVVPWGDRLWVVTYSPHRPQGSDDKLYEITPELQQIIRPESIGGTPANRMIHDESEQLFIGPYAISQDRTVRTIPYSMMFGRPTGNARHLFDPAGKIYCASMEEALYEIDVQTLAVTELWADEARKTGRHSQLPGYHGKGLATGYGAVIYANNGEHGKEAQTNPSIPSGVLASWNGKADHWSIIDRNQYTEVTTPDGIHGNRHPESNPVWAIGWDHRSLLLNCLAEGKWTRYRLVKASHSYDGAHGWNTEWPRIREIGETDLLMTMHGAFWSFPPGFRPGKTQGIRQRSSYLKVIGDFCRWGEHLVLGCDDSAKNEFLNRRKAKGELPGPAQSQSNLRFVRPDELDRMGPVGGRGAVWLNDPVTAHSPSEPMHVGGFNECLLFLKHDRNEPCEFLVEGDLTGSGDFSQVASLSVPAGAGIWQELPLASSTEWLRVICHADCQSATASFSLRRNNSPAPEGSNLSSCLASPSDTSIRGGLVRAGTKETGLQVLATSGAPGQQDDGEYYVLSPEMVLAPSPDTASGTFMKETMRLRENVIKVDGNSILFIDDDGGRYRLPIGNIWFQNHPETVSRQRIAREVCTERDLFQAAGTFFELPANNAGGFRKIRPVCTHDRYIHDFCTWRGLLVLTGLPSQQTDNNPHVIESVDRKAAVWLGSVDDLWTFGVPRGTGGPWTRTTVHPGDVSDPYLLTGYGRKTLTSKADRAARFDIECDLMGTGDWAKTGELAVFPEGERTLMSLAIEGQVSIAALREQIVLPSLFNGPAWIRFRSHDEATVTLTLTYE